MNQLLLVQMDGSPVLKYVIPSKKKSFKSLCSIPFCTEFFQLLFLHFIGDIFFFPLLLYCYSFSRQVLILNTLCPLVRIFLLLSGLLVFYFFSFFWFFGFGFLGSFFSFFFGFFSLFLLGGLHEGQEPFLQWMVDVGNTPNAPLLFSVSYGDDEDSLRFVFISFLDRCLMLVDIRSTFTLTCLTFIPPLPHHPLF